MGKNITNIEEWVEFVKYNTVSIKKHISNIIDRFHVTYNSDTKRYYTIAEYNDSVLLFTIEFNTDHSKLIFKSTGLNNTGKANLIIHTVTFKESIMDISKAYHHRKFLEEDSSTYEARIKVIEEEILRLLIAYMVFEIMWNTNVVDELKVSLDKRDILLYSPNDALNIKVSALYWFIQQMKDSFDFSDIVSDICEKYRRHRERCRSDMDSFRLGLSDMVNDLRHKNHYL